MKNVIQMVCAVVFGLVAKTLGKECSTKNSPVRLKLMLPVAIAIAITVLVCQPENAHAVMIPVADFGDIMNIVNPTGSTYGVSNNYGDVTLNGGVTGTKIHVGFANSYGEYCGYANSSNNISGSESALLGKFYGPDQYGYWGLNHGESPSMYLAILDLKDDGIGNWEPADDSDYGLGGTLHIGSDDKLVHPSITGNTAAKGTNSYLGVWNITFEYTFGDWASDQGYSSGATMPETVTASGTSITDLAGIGDYDWTTTPTTALALINNQISSIESGAFSGMANLDMLLLNDNQITSIESGAFSGLSVTTLYLSGNQITSIESGDFSGLSVMFLHLGNNQISSIESGAFSGLSVIDLSLSGNQITSIESGAFSGLSVMFLHLGNNQISSIESGAFSGLSVIDLYLGDNTPMTNLNLEGANFSSLTRFDVGGNTNMTSVSLKNAVLNQTSLAALLDGGSTSSHRIGIGELSGITELDLSGVDFSLITDLSPLGAMDDLTDLWLLGVSNMDAAELDALLDSLDTMQGIDVEGILYLTQADYDAFNIDGSGLLAAWDGEDGHHVQIIPEPATLSLLALGGLAILRKRRKQ